MDGDLIDEISFESSKSIVGNLGGKVLDYVLVLMLARYLQPTRYGLYVTGFMLASVLVTLSQLGLKDGMVRYVSKSLGESREDDIATVYVVATAVAVGISILLVGVAALSSELILDHLFEDVGVFFLLLFLASVPFRVLLVVSLGLFEGLNDMGTRVGVQLTRDALEVAVVFGFVLAGATLRSLVVGIVAVLAALGLATAALSLKRLADIGISFDPRRARSLAKEMLLYSLPLWLVAVSNLGMNWADILLLSYFLESNVVGIYQSANSLSTAFAVILVAFSTPFFPMASRLYAASNHEQLESLFQLVTRWINLLMIPGFAFSFAFARPIVTLMFGTGYADGAIVLQVLLVGTFVHTLSGNNVVLLKCSDNTSVYFAISAATLVLNLVLNVAFIPTLQGVGAALATSASLVVLNLSLVGFVYRRLRIWGYEPMKSFLVYFTSATVGLLPILAVARTVEVSVFVLAFAYAGLYFLCVQFQNGFTDTDREVVQKGVRRLKRAM